MLSEPLKKHNKLHVFFTRSYALFLKVCITTRKQNNTIFFSNYYNHGCVKKLKYLKKLQYTIQHTAPRSHSGRDIHQIFFLMVCANSMDRFLHHHFIIILFCQREARQQQVTDAIHHRQAFISSHLILTNG